MATCRRKPKILILSLQRNSSEASFSEVVAVMSRASLIPIPHDAMRICIMHIMMHVWQIVPHNARLPGSRCQITGRLGWFPRPRTIHETKINSRLGSHITASIIVAAPSCEQIRESGLRVFRDSRLQFNTKRPRRMRITVSGNSRLSVPAEPFLS